MSESTSAALTFNALRDLIAGDAVAIRARATLEPAGGPGDKVFPPTHSVDKAARSRYAFEKRRINGEVVECVLLDSVQSQANRMEEALENLWRAKRISLPVIVVDLSASAPDVGQVTSLSAPHRVADALLRDSMLDGTLFRLSEIGRSFTDATPKNASSLFRVCPTGLVFGLWDSTGPKGGRGSKFERALVSEIVGVGAVAGVKTLSRIDPTGIVTKAAEVLEATDVKEGWTDDPALARHDEKGRVVKIGDGRVSEINHSNIPPTIDDLAGGVTIDLARHTVVISLAALRKLAFGEDDDAARTFLAALALLASLAAESRGHDLRSRCLLVPREGEALSFQVVRRDGSTRPFSLDLEQAITLYSSAVDALPEGLRFEQGPGQPIATLTPSPKLAHLIARSRELAASGATE
jgi:CRISPR-associated protein Csb1